jgi:hypothetical protein
MKQYFAISLTMMGIFLMGCKQNNAPSSKIEINKMKVVLLQMMQADEYYTRMSTIDTTWKVNKKNVDFYKQILALNKVSQKDFYETLGYLEKHPVEFKEVMDSAYELSKREKLKLNMH